jgi:hypothetical protein
VFAGADVNVVTEAQWHVSVICPDSYNISGTFMEDDTIDNTVNANLGDALYLHLSINLTDNWIPFLNFSISRTSDGYLPLSKQEVLELGISINIEPRYWYYQQLHSLPDEFLALCQHCNISDLETFMLNVCQERYGLVHFFPGPSLPPNWERRISDEGVSYFHNKKTSAHRRSPAGAFACLSSPPHVMKFIFITILALDEYHRTAMKIRRQRKLNARRLRLPTFRTHRQLEKLYRTRHARTTSSGIKSDDHLVSITVWVATAGVDMEHMFEFQAQCQHLSHITLAHFCFGLTFGATIIWIMILS